MRFQDIMLGLVIGVASLIICMSFIFDSYSPQNYNINLSDDADTARIYPLQESTNVAYQDLRSDFDTIECNALGGECASITPGIGNSEADLAKSAFSAMSSFGSVLKTFNSMMTTFMGVLNLSDAARSIFIWVLGLMIAIPLILMLINAVVKNPVL